LVQDPLREVVTLVHLFRLEFFVMYAINLCWGVVTVANTYISIVNQPNECPAIIMFQKTNIVLTCKVHLEVFNSKHCKVILTLLMPLPFPYRLHFLPTSLLPLYILYTSQTD
jgi:hypothetical protein